MARREEGNEGHSSPHHTTQRACTRARCCRMSGRQKRPSPTRVMKARLACAAPPRVIQRTHLEGREGRAPLLHYHEDLAGDGRKIVMWYDDS